MGSLPVNGNAHPVPKFVSTTSTTSCVISSLLRARPTSRSPMQSPPLTKRILHLVESKTSDGSMTRHSGNQENENRHKGNRSILKTGSPCRGTRSKIDLNRKVNFRPKVVVFLFDREEGGHVSCESLTLNNEPETQNNAFAQLLSRQNNTTAHPGSVLTNKNIFKGQHQPDGRGNPSIAGVSPRPRPLPPQKNRQEPLSVVKDLQFQYFVDDSRNSILQFSLPLGQGTSANDVIVKSNKNGDKIRVLNHSGPKQSTNQLRREVCERFCLPVRVDAYQINARIDSSGILFVEAPILPGELLKPGVHVVRKTV